MYNVRIILYLYIYVYYTMVVIPDEGVIYPKFSGVDRLTIEVLNLVN